MYTNIESFSCRQIFKICHPILDIMMHSLFCWISIKIKESQSVFFVYSVFDKETKIHFQVSAVCDMLKTTFILILVSELMNIVIQ